MSCEIFTVGHSTQSSERFMDMLLRHGITAIADVRSAPYSRHNPQFNREELRATLKAEGIRYVFLGKELGARSEDECCYVDDKVSYKLLAKTELFQAGIARVIEGAAQYRIALMCAEKDPLDCHRTILVSRELVDHGCNVKHILAGGLLESHADAMNRLVSRMGLAEADMFRSHTTPTDEAYERQGELIAYDRRAHRLSGRRNELMFNEGERP